MRRTITHTRRDGAAAVALTTVALLGVPGPARAAALPDLSFGYESFDISDSGTSPGLYVQNGSETAATGVTLRLDLSTLADTVVASPADSPSSCTLDGTTVTCTIGTVASGAFILVRPVELTARPGTPPGPAGTVTATLDGDQDDQNPADDSASLPVTILEPGPDLAVSVDDLNTPATRVGGGDRRPIRAEIRNQGSLPVTGLTFTLQLGEGAAFVERYAECAYTDHWPDDDGGPWAYGPNEVTCSVSRTLAPGEALPLVAPNGRPLFTARFGRNLWGPAEHLGYFSVAPLDAGRRAPAGGTGASLDALLRTRQVAAAEDEQWNNSADFSYWSRRNAIDVAVRVSPVRGAVGRTVDLTFQITNRGPSDGGGPSAVITAPAGTVLLPSDWCWTDGTANEQLPESPRVRCNFESYFPTVHSGSGRISHTIPLKIKSAPGRNGTVVVSGELVAGTESRPADNTARIVLSR